MNKNKSDLQLKIERRIDEIRDVAIRSVDRMVDEGIIKDCTDTNDTTEFDVQDIIFDEIKNSTHPEMQDIQPGEELVVMKITNPEEKSVDKDRFKLDSPALHGEDSLHKSLQDRINELKDESKSDEDDDDDDGGAGVVLSR